MEFEILGWKFKKDSQEQKVEAPYVLPTNDDAAFVINSGYYGYNAYHVTFDTQFTNENDLIKKYRDIALSPEVDLAITDIVNEAINGDNESSPVELILDDLDVSENIKKKFTDEFEKIVKLLKFNERSYEIFRKWYVDGRINYFIVINPNKAKDGIKELRYISPLDIKKVREEKQSIGPGGIPVVNSYDEYFLYNPRSSAKEKSPTQGVKLSADSVAYVTSELIDEDKGIVYSYLHKAMKSANQLKMIEDAAVIYRLSRAPERRIFYVDTGNLPPKQAEQYLYSIATKSKNKMVYDALTGEMKDSTSNLSMMEDMYLPRREGGKGTEVSTLPGGQNLGEMTDVEYFRKKLYNALNVPYSRIAPDQASQAFGLGKSNEISREEVKFNKFISRLRKSFSGIFYDLLGKQLIMKKIITKEEWEEFKENIAFNFLGDTYFAELKEAEILKERIGTVQAIGHDTGSYFSREYVYKKVLRMTDEEIEEMKEQIEQDKKDNPELENQGDGFRDDPMMNGMNALPPADPNPAPAPAAAPTKAPTINVHIDKSGKQSQSKAS